METGLIVGHPGHELTVHALVEREQPLVWVVTDGSGSTGASRIAATRRVLDRAAAVPGGVFGAFSDRAAYGHILSGNVDVFAELVVRVAAQTVEAGVQRLVSDGLEGFNPIHDLTRSMADAVVALVAARSGRRIETFEFALSEGGASSLHPAPRAPWRLELTEDEWRRKLAAAESYTELRSEVDRMVAVVGADRFQAELLFPVAPDRGSRPPGVGLPYYERFGQQRVGSGVYGEVIRYGRHIRPLVERLFVRLGLAPPLEA